MFDYIVTVLMVVEFEVGFVDGIEAVVALGAVVVVVEVVFVGIMDYASTVVLTVNKFVSILVFVIMNEVGFVASMVDNAVKTLKYFQCHLDCRKQHLVNSLLLCCRSLHLELSLLMVEYLY